MRVPRLRRKAPDLGHENQVLHPMALSPLPFGPAYYVAAMAAGIAAVAEDDEQAVAFGGVVQPRGQLQALADVQVDHKVTVLARPWACPA